MRALRYALEQALVSLRRSGSSAAMSVGTITVAFLTLGGFLLIAGNIQAIVDRWAEAAEMSIYLQEEVDEATRGQLVSDLQAHPAVAAVEFVSREQARQRFTTDFPELADIATSMENNPFPASLEVRLHTTPEATGATEALAAQLTTRPGIADVRYDRQWLDRLLMVVRGIQVAGLTIAAVLVIGAAFTVAAVVRLSTTARHDEIEIMELVGAPFSFIRGPSIAEGTLLGGIGAGLALVVLWAIFLATRAQFGEALAGLVGNTDFQFLRIRESVMLIAAALAVGGLAGTLGSRN